MARDYDSRISQFAAEFTSHIIDQTLNGPIKAGDCITRAWIDAGPDGMAHLWMNVKHAKGSIDLMDSTCWFDPSADLATCIDTLADLGWVSDDVEDEDGRAFAETQVAELTQRFKTAGLF